MADDTDLVTITKKGHEDDVVPRWALPAREADGWKLGKALADQPESTPDSKGK